MRNVFDQYSQTENKLTHSLVSCLYEDKKLLTAFLDQFCPNFFIKDAKLIIGQQTLPNDNNQVSIDKKIASHESNSLPDAVIYNDEKCLIIESKLNSDLVKDQLIRHEKTIKKRGFNVIRGLAIVIIKVPNVTLNDWQQITWNAIYEWGHLQKSKSEWAKKLIHYFNVVENKMIQDKKLYEGNITKFTGVHFDDDNPYSEMEAKRQLKLLVEKIKQNKKLEQDLGLDFSKPHNSGTWSAIAFQYGGKKEYKHTDLPHFTVGVSPKFLDVVITIPHAVITELKNKFNKLSWKEFQEIIRQILANYEKAFGKNTSFIPTMLVLQRRYPSQKSKPIEDALVMFDMRTAFQEFAEGLKPRLRVQEEWLKLAFDIYKNKKSNIQLQVGANFSYNKDTLINHKDADKVAEKAFRACKPLTDYLFS